MSLCNYLLSCGKYKNRLKKITKKKKKIYMFENVYKQTEFKIN